MIGKKNFGLSVWAWAGRVSHLCLDVGVGQHQPAVYTCSPSTMLPFPPPYKVEERGASRRKSLTGEGLGLWWRSLAVLYVSASAEYCRHSILYYWQFLQYTICTILWIYNFFFWKSKIAFTTSSSSALFITAMCSVAYAATFWLNHALRSLFY